MKKAEVKVGKVYAVKVSGRIVPVRLTAEIKRPTPLSGSLLKGINLNSGREVNVRSAARCRAEMVTDPDNPKKWVTVATASAMGTTKVLEPSEIQGTITGRIRSYNGASNPCAVCQQSHRNTVHTNPTQYGYHQHVPEKVERPINDLMYADTAEVAAALRTMLDNAEKDPLSLSNVYVTIPKVVLEKMVEALELVVRNAA